MAMVWVLYEYREVQGVHATRETAEADARWLRDQARRDWDTGTWRSTTEYIEPQIEIIETTPLTAPRYAGRDHD